LPSQQRSTLTKLEPAVALPGVTNAGAASQLCLDLKPVPLTNTHSQDICSNPGGPVGELNFFCKDCFMSALAEKGAACYIQYPGCTFKSPTHTKKTPFLPPAALRVFLLKND